MSKHTPGPWRLEMEDQARVYGADSFCVAAIQIDDDDYGRPAEEKANARLIAAAPEMLESLRAISERSLCEEYSKSELISIIRNAERIATEAIAKAEGRAS